jgi:hypothetical protein
VDQFVHTRWGDGNSIFVVLDLGWDSYAHFWLLVDLCSKTSTILQDAKKFLSKSAFSSKSGQNSFS